MAFMLGSSCSSCCGCSDCEFRWIHDGLDSGTGQCDERTAAADGSIGVRCGQFSARHAPGKFFQQTVDAIGYNGIVDTTGFSASFDRKNVGVYLFSGGPARSFNGAEIQKERRGWLEAPTAGPSGSFVSGTGWVETFFGTVSLLCLLGRPLLSIGVTYQLRYSKITPTGTGFWFIQYESRYTQGPRVGIEQVIRGGDPVSITASYDSFTIGTQTYSWLAVDNREESSGGPIPAKPDVGPLYDEGNSFSASVYIPDQDCCTGISCSEGNPLP